MRLAFGIVSLFSWGGLQRDCMRLARAATENGHDVTIFTARTFGEIPRDLNVRLLPARALTNGGRNRQFSKALRRATAGHFDRVIGFDKIPGLDVLYCGDLCFAESHSSFLQSLNPRQRIMTDLEGSCFARDSTTRILALAEPQLQAYQAVWHTPAERFIMLPPPLDPDRKRPHMRNDGTRERVRAELGIAPNELALLCIGHWSYRKGFDRAVAALPGLEKARVLIAGTPTDDAYLRQLLASRRLRGVKNRVSILGPRTDIAELIAASDLLIHVARSETTGTVILEALVNGLPVITSSVCGYANHVEQANAGIVLPEPFEQADLIDAIHKSTTAQHKAWSANGIAYGAGAFLYQGMNAALTAITEYEKRPTRTSSSPRFISVIVTTYNQPEALNAVLRALAQQTDKNFEVVVADDGSDSATADVLKSWKTRLPQPLTHVWHEDRGFRAAEIRNRAILASSGDYCIFLDGDCIPRTDFVAAHRYFAESAWFVTGNRVLLSRNLTARVLRDNIDLVTWTFNNFIQERLRGNINRITPLLRTRLKVARRALPQRWWAARSCNLAMWRSDLDHVDGFDGRYVGWGLEDSDLLIRLLRAGVRRKDGRFATGVYHLWHPLAQPNMLSDNQPLLDAVQRSDRTRAILGMSSLLPAGATPDETGHARANPAQAAMA